MNNLKVDYVRVGFTLAEVLITLGVIGVVAAITMPTLIQNYQKHVTVNQLKKAYSELNQAINISKLENDELNNYDYVELTSEEAYNFAEKYLFPYLKTAKICTPENLSECYAKAEYQLNGKNIQNNIRAERGWATFVLANGTTVAMRHETNNLAFRIDLNGLKNPNILGKDMFAFGLMENGQFKPAFFEDAFINRKRLTKTDGYCASDKTSHGLGCAALIMIDSWQIKDDYPW